MLFISYDNRKTLFFIQIYHSLEVQRNQHVRAVGSFFMVVVVGGGAGGGGLSANVTHHGWVTAKY